MNATIIGKTVDVNGVAWDVRERRETSHGFCVELGRPQGADMGKGRRGNGVAVVLTPPLLAYLRANTRPADVSLPVGRAVVRRLRQKAGIAPRWQDWWASREGDLRRMTLEKFCAAHGCSIGAASQRRKALLGL